MYKRGKLLYKERLKEYEKEKSMRFKIERADKIVKILITANSLYSQNNKELNKKLKKLKTANEIEAILLK